MSGKGQKGFARGRRIEELGIRDLQEDSRKRNRVGDGKVETENTENCRSEQAAQSPTGARAYRTAVLVSCPELLLTTPSPPAPLPPRGRGGEDSKGFVSPLAPLGGEGSGVRGLSEIRWDTTLAWRRALMAKTGMSFIINESHVCAPRPIAELRAERWIGKRGGRESRWDGDQRVKSRIKPSGVKSIFIRDIAQNGDHQTHGEHLLPLQSLEVAWRPDLGRI